jgi:hypothetical protein
MADVFSPKIVPGATQAELKARGSSNWNPSLGRAKTWIHISSMAEGAKLVISTYQGYSDGYKSYNRPNILVTGFKITAKGEYGTTRAGTLQMTVFDQEDMNALADDYLIPDMSVRVQFGWSVGASVGAPPLISGQDLDSKAIIAMQTNAASNPIYEGYQGRVQGWDVKLIPDINAWEVTITLIGAADAVAETSLSYVSEKCNCNKEVTGQTAEGDGETTEVVERTSNLMAALLELYDDPSNLSGLKSLGGDQDYFAEKISYPGFSRDENGQEDSQGMLFISADLDATETYLSWGTVEALLTRTSGQTWSDGSPTGFELNSKGTKLFVPEQDEGRWFSADPRICILPGGGVTFEFDALPSIGDIAGAIGNMLPFLGDNSVQAKAQPSTDCFVDSTTVDLSKIMISSIHLMKRVREFEQSKTPFMQAVNTLLKDINVACGGVWELEVVDATSVPGMAPSNGASRLVIIDSNRAIEEGGIFSFVATPGKGGFCRDISLEYKPTDAMKTQALFGSGGSGEGGGSSNTPCKSRFIMYTQGSKANKGKPKQSDPPPTPHCNSEKCNKANEKESPVKKLAREAVGVNIDGARAYLEEQRGKRDTKKFVEGGGNVYCANAILPMNFGAVVTGIGGFKWGQIVSCDRIPDEMTKTVRWQVTTVEHEVTPDDWTTKINTVARQKKF